MNIVDVNFLIFVLSSPTHITYHRSKASLPAQHMLSGIPFNCHASPMKMNYTLIGQLQMQVAQDSQKAFKELYCLFFPRLSNFATIYVHKKEIAEELVNDVMVKIWNHRTALTEIQNLETYLFVAVRNHSFNYNSSYSAYHVTVDSDGYQGRVTNLNDPQKEMEWKELSHQLDRTIDTLPDQCRTVFKLIREEGFRYKQVAEILNISPRTVETQLSRAIKKLDQVIQTHQRKTKQSKKVI